MKIVNFFKTQFCATKRNEINACRNIQVVAAYLKNQHLKPAFEILALYLTLHSNTHILIFLKLFILTGLNAIFLFFLFFPQL